MGGFSASWLALREAADHRARHGGLSRRLANRFIDLSPIRVLDLGSGTGSNLRATAPLLGQHQEWTLVDHDPTLLEEAARALSIWADEARAIGDALVLVKNGQNIGVTFRIADLTQEIETLLAKAPDLVTASALFDLVSPAFITRMVSAVAAHGASFYTVLTYDGQDGFTPHHPLDSAVIAAFAAHQGGDKGFGPAAGPKATGLIAEAFRLRGYVVETGASPWRLGPADRPLMAALLDGVAAAVGETGHVEPETLAAWHRFRLDSGTALETGHLDLLAYPA